MEHEKEPDPLKILTVSHGFPPDEQAGAELYAFEVSQGLRSRGDEVVVFCPGRREGRSEFERVEEEVEGLRVLRMHREFRDLHSLAETYDSPRVARVFADVLEAERPDLVHVHHIAGLGVSAITGAKASGIPVAVTLHDFWFQCARGQRRTPEGHVCEEIQPWRCAFCIAPKRLSYAANFLRGSLRGTTAESEGEGSGSRLLKLPLRALAEASRQAGTRPIRRRTATMRRALASADLVLAPSRFLLREFSRWGIPEDRLVLSEYGIDHGPWDAATEEESPLEAGDRGPKVRFGYVGSLIPTKGVELLVEAFEQLGPDEATLQIHGSAPAGAKAERFEERLRDKARHPGLSFRGRFEHRDIAAVFDSFDVLVMPSTWFENAPLTLYESALAGCPVITSDLGGMREFAEEFGTALTFPAGDRAALQRALRRFVDEPELRGQLARPRRTVRTLDEDIDGLRGHFARLRS